LCIITANLQLWTFLPVNPDYHSFSDRFTKCNESVLVSDLITLSKGMNKKTLMSQDINQYIKLCGSFHIRFHIFGTNLDHICAIFGPYINRFLLLWTSAGPKLLQIWQMVPGQAHCTKRHWCRSILPIRTESFGTSGPYPLRIYFAIWVDSCI